MSTTHPTVLHCGFHADPELGVCYRTLGFMGRPGYRVGDDGSVWTAWKRGGPRQWFISDSWVEMKQRIGSTGRLALMLMPERKPKLVHRLVLTAFVGPCPEGKECCHNDGNPLNNSVPNLRWDTRKSNHADKKKHGTEQRGEKSGKAKMTDEKVREVRRLCQTGMPQRSVATKFQITQATVWHIVRRKTWTHVV